MGVCASGAADAPADAVTAVTVGQVTPIFKGDTMRCAHTSSPPAHFISLSACTRHHNVAVCCWRLCPFTPALASLLAHLHPLSHAPQSTRTSFFCAGHGRDQHFGSGHCMCVCNPIFPPRAQHAHEAGPACCTPASCRQPDSPPPPPPPLPPPRALSLLPCSHGGRNFRDVPALRHDQRD